MMTQTDSTTIRIVDVNRNIRNLRPDQIGSMGNLPGGCLVLLAEPIMEHLSYVTQFWVTRKEGRSLRDKLKAAREKAVAEPEPPAADSPFGDFDFPGDKDVVPAEPVKRKRGRPRKNTVAE